jgi:hypothetical protein
MMLKALIVEQLDADGALRTFEMQPSSHGRKLVVAFADEWDERRNGPFHFLDESDARRFEEGFALCRARKIGAGYFYNKGRTYHFETKWSGIPTQRQWLSYYALSLSEFAIPIRLSVSDPHRPRKEYARAIRRDDARHRYVVYLECSSSFGKFDFVISCDFEVSEGDFSRSEYRDAQTGQDGPDGDNWQYLLDRQQQRVVQQFFVEELHMGDNYSAGQAGAMGPGAKACDMMFEQNWNQALGPMNLAQLAGELGRLHLELRSEATEPEHELAIGSVAAAEAAAKAGNGAKALEYLKKAGTWALNVATKIGTDMAVAALKASMGMPSR